MNHKPDSTQHQELLDLCAAFAVGALDPGDSARLEEHLREGCPACLEEVAAFQRTAGALGAALDGKSPPPSAEARLMDRLAALREARAERVPPATTGRAAGARIHWLWAAAAALILIPALWLAAGAHLEIARLERELAAHETTTDPVVSVFDLEPAPAAAGARARASYDPRTRTWRLFVHDLPPPPEGTTYQGWLVTGGVSVDFGLLRPDGTGHAYLERRLPGEPSGVSVAVTLEPEKGSDGPAGPPVFRHPRTGPPDS